MMRPSLLHLSTRSRKAACAATACAATCAASTALGRSPCSCATAQSTPKYSADGCRYDLSTYSGRAQHFVTTLGDLRTLFLSAEEIKRAQSELRMHAEGASSLDDDALWRAKKIVDATCHPTTGEIICAPFRFAGFAPANLIICAGLLRPNPTLLHSAFWQWVNQSYNALVNYSNASVAGGEVLKPYMAATSSALAIGLGLQEAARRLSGGTARAAAVVRLTVPMLAVAVSANVNLLLVRGNELEMGISVSTSDGTPLGMSVAAAQRALGECAAARVIWTALLLTATPLCVSAALVMLPASIVASSAGRACTELGVSFAVIWLAVPLSLAVFPQRECISIDSVEPAVREAWDAQGGEEPRVVYFNKGL
jgi:tricarboxylate carrier